MTTVNTIKTQLQNQSMDIRDSRRVELATGISPRFMDQKCTPDILTAAATWILNLSERKQKTGFTTRQVWDSRNFATYVDQEFSKPSVFEQTAQSEFDKVIAQPLKTLSFAGALNATRVGRSIEYTVLNKTLLQYLDRGPREARIFLVQYIWEVLRQSGIKHHFETYFESSQTNDDYIRLRDHFIRYIQSHTNIKTAVEVRRIFPKVINPLAHSLNAKGAERGRVSDRPIMASDLLYNRDNFRDKGKRKDITRQQTNQAAF